MTKSRQPDHQRKNRRLDGYDYSQPGGYFVTLVTWQRECLFGEMVRDELRVNEFGKIVIEEWLRSAEIRREIRRDEFVVMPNHFHGIVEILAIPNPVGLTSRSALQDAIFTPIVDMTSRSSLQKPGLPPSMSEGNQPHGPKPASLGALIAGFKSACTVKINQIRQSPRMPVWQGNYYDHIIRDDHEMDRIRLYIQENPINWAEDEQNPSLQLPRM